jgi:hypothetical protein
MTLFSFLIILFGPAIGLGFYFVREALRIINRLNIPIEEAWNNKEYRTFLIRVRYGMIAVLIYMIAVIALERFLS